MLILLWKFQKQNTKFQSEHTNLILESSSPYGGFTEGVHLFPFRTEQLSPSWPMVLGHNPGRVGSRRLIENPHPLLRDEDYFSYK